MKAYRAHWEVTISRDHQQHLQRLILATDIVEATKIANSLDNLIPGHSQELVSISLQSPDEVIIQELVSIRLEDDDPSNARTIYHSH